GSGPAAAARVVIPRFRFYKFPSILRGPSHRSGQGNGRFEAVEIVADGRGEGEEVLQSFARLLEGHGDPGGAGRARGLLGAMARARTAPRSSDGRTKGTVSRAGSGWTPAGRFFNSCA